MAIIRGESEKKKRLAAQRLISYPRKKRKAIKKSVRLEVHQKYGGCCAYCGEGIEYKGLNVDHILAVELGGADNIENLNPSCRRCNNFKRVWTIEEFRSELSLQVKRGREQSVNFRNAERFGLIEIIEKPIVFYFEVYER